MVLPGRIEHCPRIAHPHHKVRVCMTNPTCDGPVHPGLQCNVSCSMPQLDKYSVILARLMLGGEGTGGSGRGGRGVTGGEWMGCDKSYPLAFSSSQLMAPDFPYPTGIAEGLPRSLAMGCNLVTIAPDGRICTWRHHVHK